MADTALATTPVDGEQFATDDQQYTTDQRTAPVRGSKRQSTVARPLQPWDRIVLDGALMSYSREDWELEVIAQGFVPTATITRRTRLVVAKDLRSLSWTSFSARLRRVPVTDEAGLRAIFARPVALAS